MQPTKITTCLWFESQAADAAKFYISILPDSKLLSESPMVTMFQLSGQPFMALNGKRGEPFTDAMSLMVTCEDQAEIDRLWGALLAGGGRESMCGWLKDRFGVAWQIVPRALGTLMGDADAKKAGAVGQALLQMRKIDIAALERAHAGK